MFFFHAKVGVKNRTRCRFATRDAEPAPTTHIALAAYCARRLLRSLLVALAALAALVALVALVVRVALIACALVALIGCDTSR